MSKQVLDSVDSLPLLSEPPHIGNWFSSYAYESPVLSGVDGFQRYEVSKNIESGNGRRRRRKRAAFEDAEIIEYPVKVWRASDSISCPVLSESLDAKDSFSSCVPETPLMAYSDDVIVPESDIGDIEDTSSRGCKADSSREEDNSAEHKTNGKSDSLPFGVNMAFKGLVQCKNSVADDKRVGQDVDSSDELSLASEPPDIRNWFSSYVYESPNMDTVQDVILSDHAKKFDDKEYSNGFIHDDKYEHPVLKAGETRSSRVSNEMLLEKISQESPYCKIMQNNNRGSPSCIELELKDGKGSGENLETMFSQEANHSATCISNHSSCEGGKSFINPILRMDSAESLKSEDCVESGYNVQRKSPFKREAEVIMDKENDINDFGENGFISTRKGRNSQLGKESPSPRAASVESPLSGVTVASNCHSHGVTRRKVLAETTNLQDPSALGTTGKWRCPQRTKPNLGPPMKQLRLGQWVRRA